MNPCPWCSNPAHLVSERKISTTDVLILRKYKCQHCNRIHTTLKSVDTMKGVEDAVDNRR